MRERKAADSMEARVGIKVSQPSNVFFVSQPYSGTGHIQRRQ